MSAARLSANDKLRILASYEAGEKSAVIAARFGVDPSYPTILARRRGSTLRQPDLAAKMKAVRSRKT